MTELEQLSLSLKTWISKWTNERKELEQNETTEYRC